MLASKPASGVKFQYRAASGESLQMAATEWEQRGLVLTVPMSNNAVVGLALSAHPNAELATATFYAVETSGFGVEVR